MSKFITIDFGNSIVKTNLGLIFNSQMVKTNVNNIEFSEAIIFNDECYAIGQGDYENNSEKSEKENLEQLILYAISCSTKEDKINLILNVPINQLSTKQDMINRLQNKEFTFIINSNLHNVKLVEKTIKVGKVAVAGEAIASYYTLNEDLDDFITILDIGSKTINYATYTEIGKIDLNKSGTLEFGIHYLYNMVIEYYKNERKITYTIEDVDKRVRAHRIYIPTELKLEFIKKIKNEMIGKGFTDYNDYSIKCVGGGSLVLKDTIEKDCFADAIVLEDALTRNVLGLELIGNTLGF